MKNLYEVLRAKELEIKRLEKEIEALRIVLPMLAEEGDIAKEGADAFRPQAVSNGGSYSAVQQGAPPQYTPAPQGVQPMPRPEAVKPGRSWP